MRHRSAGLEPAAIQAMRSSRERTVGAGALSWRVDINLKPFSLLTGQTAHGLATARPLLM